MSASKVMLSAIAITYIQLALWMMLLIESMCYRLRRFAPKCLGRVSDCSGFFRDFA